MIVEGEMQAPFWLFDNELIKEKLSFSKLAEEEK
jgi:hypothetical protein